MSHFTEVKTKIKDIGILKKALKELKIEHSVDSGQQITNFYGDNLDVDIKIPTGTKYDIGIKQTENDDYELTADWELLEKMKYDVEGFKQKVLQKYSYLKVKQELEVQGFTLEEENVDEEGNLQLSVCKW